MRLRKASRVRVLSVAFAFFMGAYPTLALAEEAAAEPGQCASVATGIAGTLIGGSTGEERYPYSGTAAVFRAEYAYCAIRHLELGAGLEYLWASDWHAFVPQALVRGYIGPSTREDEFGLHVHAGAAIVALPYGSVIGGQSVELVQPLAHDDLLVGPLLSGGIDYRHWFDQHFAFQLSLDIGASWSSPKKPGDDHDLLESSVSIGVVMGW